jgi:hypothetical protein
MEDLTMAIASINQFLGINEDIDTQLKLGEASSMQNYRVTENFKLKQIEGYEGVLGTQIASGKTIQGQWYGKIGNTYFHIVACNGHLYKIITTTATDLGTLTDAPTFMFQNSSKVYIMNGTEYKSFDGTNLIDVVGYVPTVYIGSPPAGGGTLLEGINLINGQKKQKFNGNGVASTLQLFETALTSVDTVKLGGVTKTLTTDYTVNLTTGVITLVTPATWVSGTDNIEVTFTKTVTANRSEIASCRKAIIFGTRVHVWGNRNTGYQNKRWHSGLDNGITSAEYFPSTQVMPIGPNENSLTDIVTQYDRQIIFTDGGRTYYSYYENVSDVIAFPVFELNETTGCQAFGQAQVLDNFPVSIQDGVYRWESTGVRDERNAQMISQRVKESLKSFVMASVVTYDWEQKREYWCAYQNTVLVYNYQINVWYKFVLHGIIKSMIVINGAMIFGDNDGHLYKFDESYRMFNIVAISAEWEMGYYDWGQEWLRKFTNQCWITMEPDTRTNLDVYWITDRDQGEKQASTSIGYRSFSFDTLDFSDFTFNTVVSPRPKRVRTKAKKFAFWKLILRNDKAGYTSSVLGITTDARIGGNVK